MNMVPGPSVSDVVETERIILVPVMVNSPMVRSHAASIAVHAVRIGFQAVLPAPLRPRLDLVPASVPNLLSPHNILAFDGAAMPHSPLGNGVALTCLDLQSSDVNVYAKTTTSFSGKEK
jgi:hypothetical protein